MAELIVGIVAAAFAFPTCIQALTHGVRRLKHKNKPQQHQIAGHTSHNVNTQQTLNTSHQIRTHHTLNTSHSVQLGGQTYHSVEHNVFFHVGSGVTVLVTLVSAMLYMAYHLGHSHGYNGRQALVHGIDMAINQNEQCPIERAESPLTATLLALTSMLEVTGHVLLSAVSTTRHWLGALSLWIASAPIHALHVSFVRAYALGQHGSELIEASSRIHLARAWVAFAVTFVLKLAFTVAVAGAAFMLMGIGLVDYVCASCAWLKMKWRDRTPPEKLLTCEIFLMVVLTAALTTTTTNTAVSLW